MNTDVVIRLLVLSVLGVAVIAGVSAQASTTTTLISESQTDTQGRAYGDLYEELVSAMITGGATDIIGDKLWVPWFCTSSSCEDKDLQRAGACPADIIDGTHNCMVTDEFSQVGVLLSMSSDATHMRQYVNMVESIQSTNGKLPSWRVYRDGDTIRVCDPKINGNCDSASDADARVIISLWTASKNTAFPQADRDRYAQLAREMAADFVKYDLVKKTYQTPQGEITYWLAAGANAARGGLSSYDFAYTGYYPDAITAMLQSCTQTGDQMYCDVAKDFAKNYLLAADFDGSTFSASPGRSFSWNTQSGTPTPQCTGSCSPIVWDDADAPRAFGLCEAQYYAEIAGKDVGLGTYCQVWEKTHLSDATRVSTQYYPDGTGKTPQSGYFAQGLQALARTHAGSDKFRATINSALSHYVSQTKTWDWASCHGVYTQALATRALGVGLGRDLAVFTNAVSAPTTDTSTPTDTTNTDTNTDTTTGTDSGTGTSCQTTQAQGGVEDLAFTCSVAGGCSVTSDVTSGTCRTIKATTSYGGMQIMACEKTANIEVYRQQYPNGVAFSACLGDACVDRYGGYATTAYPAATTQTTCTEQPAPVPAEDPAVPEPAPTPQPTQEPSPTTPQQPSPTVAAIGDLPVTCSADSGCTKLQDSNDGSCRTLRYAANGANIKVLACKKAENRVEVYRQVSSPGFWNVCVNTGCVGSTAGGFAVTTLSSDAQVPSTDTSQPETTPSDPVKTPPTQQPTTENTRVSSQSLQCDAQGGCRLTRDETSGTCRTVEYSLSGNILRMLACEKGDAIEVYRQVYPTSTNFNACIGQGCVNNKQGFARFTP